MASNPYVNRVETADGNTLMDITDTTATSGDVSNGQVFYDRSGARTVGSMAVKLDQAAAYAEYSSSSLYAVSDIVTHEGKIHSCNTEISTPEEWTSSHWTEIILSQIIGGKTDKVASATNGNFAGLDSNGNLTDSGYSSGDFVAVLQSASDAGKALGIDVSGQVVPVPFSGDDFTGATASTAGVHGYVPAPSAGAQTLYLKGDGTWADPPGGKTVWFNLDTVTNTSGSYTHTTTVSGAAADMACTVMVVGNIEAFLDTITIAPANGSITLSCNSVSGTSTVKVGMQYVAGASSITSSEFDVLAGRIGTLSNLTTTEKTNLVGAVNEVKGSIPPVVDNLTSTSTTSALSANQGKVLSEGKVSTSDIADNLTTNDATKVLSAKQGYTLNSKTENVETATTITNVSSLDVLKTGLQAVANEVSVDHSKLIRFYSGFTGNGFYANRRYKGYLVVFEKSGSTATTFTILFEGEEGHNVSVGYRSSTWTVEELALNSNKVNKTIELSTGTSLNDVVTSGFYRLLNNHTNAPTVRDCSWSQMIVSRGSDTILQMIGQNSDNRWFVRTGYGIGGSNPTWTSWEELTLNSKIFSAATIEKFSYYISSTGVYLQSNAYYIAAIPVQPAQSIKVTECAPHADTYSMFVNANNTQVGDLIRHRWVSGWSNAVTVPTNAVKLLVTMSVTQRNVFVE